MLEEVVVGGFVVGVVLGVVVVVVVVLDVVVVPGREEVVVGASDVLVDDEDVLLDELAGGADVLVEVGAPGGAEGTGAVVPRDGCLLFRCVVCFGRVDVVTGGRLGAALFTAVVVVRFGATVVVGRLWRRFGRTARCGARRCAGVVCRVRCRRAGGLAVCVAGRMRAGRVRSSEVDVLTVPRAAEVAGRPAFRAGCRPARR